MYVNHQLSKEIGYVVCPRGLVCYTNDSKVEKIVTSYVSHAIRCCLVRIYIQAPAANLFILRTFDKHSEWATVSQQSLRVCKSLVLLRVSG